MPEKHRKSQKWTPRASNHWLEDQRLHLEIKRQVRQLQIPPFWCLFFLFVFLFYIFIVMCPDLISPISPSLQHLEWFSGCKIPRRLCFGWSCDPHMGELSYNITELIASCCSGGRSVEKSDIMALPGPQVCSAKWLPLCTSESEPGSETKTTLPSHKYLIWGSKIF